MKRVETKDFGIAIKDAKDMINAAENRDYHDLDIAIDLERAINALKRARKIASHN